MTSLKIVLSYVTSGTLNLNQDYGRHDFTSYVRTRKLSGRTRPGRSGDVIGRGCVRAYLRLLAHALNVHVGLAMDNEAEDKKPTKIGFCLAEEKQVCFS